MHWSRWKGGVGGIGRIGRATAAAILALAALLVQTATPARAASPETPANTSAAPRPSLQVETIATRGGASQSVLLVQPAAPKAVLLVVPRDHRTLHLSADGAVQGEAAASFLVRSRLLFAARGLAVALPTATEYPRNAALLDDELRIHGNPVADLTALAERLRQRLKVPVWLAAEHNSAAFAAGAVVTVGASRDFDGLLLTGSVVGGKEGLGSVDASKIGIPTLLVQHKEDACSGAGYGEAESLFDALAHAPRKDLIGVGGGRDRDGKRTNPCSPFARHGFSGIESLVVGGIADWLEKRP